jgi:hypothetical protein
MIPHVPIRGTLRLVSLSCSDSMAVATAHALPTVSDEPRVVELVGLPGSGKTTVVGALLAADRWMRRVRLRGWRDAALHLRNGCRLLAPFAQQYRRMGARRWNRLSMMVRLETLGDLLAPSRTRGSEAVVLDQGPVYMLSILQRARQEPLAPLRNGRLFEQYWRRTVAAWAHRLDCVVQLEARDEILYRRILARGTSHPVALLTREEASASFARSRASRASILASLQSAGGGPALLCLQTDELCLQDTVDRILACLGHCVR